MEIALFFLALTAAGALLYLMIHKTRHGSACCGEIEGMEKKVRSHDRNPKHYPFVYLAGIEGMVCANCARRVENALCAKEGILAKADLERKTVVIRSKHPLRREDVLECLKGTQYTLLEFEEENHEFK